MEEFTAFLIVVFAPVLFLILCYSPFKKAKAYRRRKAAQKELGNLRISAISDKDRIKAEKAQEAAQRKQAAAYDRQRKAALKKQQAEMEIERLKAEFDEQRELNDIIQERYETISEEKRKADAMAVENPALLAKYEKVLRQRITSQNKMRSLQKKIENLTDIINL